MIRKYYEDYPEYYDRILAETEDGETYTYYDLKVFAEMLGEYVTPRNTVFVLCEHCVGELFGILSFLRKKVVMYLFDSQLSNERIEELLNEYTPNYMYVPVNQKENYPDYRVLFEKYGMALLVNQKVMVPPVKTDNLAFFLSTSGSTGDSKLVRSAYENYVASSNSVIKMCGITKDDVTATFLPMQYAYAISTIFAHVAVGAKVIITKLPVIQNRFWELCKEKKVTDFYAVPYMYECICQLGIEERLGMFRTLSVAGGKLKTYVSEKCTRVAADHNVLFYNEYGQTEAGCMSYSIKSKDGSYHPEDNIGEPITDGKTYLLDVNNQIITEKGVSGNLMYEGGSVCMGYCAGKHEIDKEDPWKGVLNTGDIAVINDLGKIEIVGRAKRFIKIYGKRYSLDHIEHLMNQEVKDCQIVTSGIDGMLVIFTNNQDSIAACKKYIRTTYGISTENYRVEYIETFPLNFNGKIAYAELLSYVNEKFA